MHGKGGKGGKGPFFLKDGANNNDDGEFIFVILSHKHCYYERMAAFLK